MELLLVVFIFIAVVLLVEGIFLLTRSWWNPETRRVKTQLRQTQRGGIWAGGCGPGAAAGDERYPLVKPVSPGRADSGHRPDRTHGPPGQSELPGGVVLLASVVFAVVGFAVSSYVTRWFLVWLAVGALLGALPILYVYIKKQKRINRFEEQLPEAMDMLARSLKAGHAFTGGLQMVGQEFTDPIGTEFSKTLDEINFGVAYEDALKSLSSRIDSDDLKLFVISVIIQRTSGGNLAEILENIGRLIRERFKLKGNIKTLTAEGRISAYVLIALPFFLAYVMYLLNPKYISTLFTDPAGHFLIAAACVMMIIGAIVMKRMVDIKV